MKLKTVLMAVVLGLVSALSFSQGTLPTRSDHAIYAGYPLSATSYTYCSISLPRPGTGRITTSGSSTTVTRADSTSEPFTNLIVGDMLIPSQPGTSIGAAVPGNSLARTITAIGSTHSVTVNSAVDLSGGLGTGYAFTYQTYADESGTTRCGTGNAAGWVPLPAGANTVSLVVSSQSGVTTLSYSIEGLPRGGGFFEGAVPMIQTTFTSFSAVISGGPAASRSHVIGETFGWIRVGLKVDAGSARVNVILSNER